MRKEAYGEVQELFLHSPCPTAALQMRKDLQHWPQALSLANQFDPSQTPLLACNYAQVCCAFLVRLNSLPFCH